MPVLQASPFWLEAVSNRQTNLEPEISLPKQLNKYNDKDVNVVM